MLRITTILTTSVFVLLSVYLQAQSTWKPAQSRLTTQWTAKVSPENPLPEYPRPQMTRTRWQNLNGLWNFQLMDLKTQQTVVEEKILVPYPVESALSGIARRVEPKHLMVYNRDIEIPADWKGQRILLHFGAVDYETEVLVNARKVGSHKGGYDPFFFDITDFLNPGNLPNLLTVQVKDPTDSGGQPVGKQRLNPSGIWYTPTSGIWQTVWMEPVPDTYISGLRIEPDFDKSRVIIRAEVAGKDKNKTSVTASILEDGRILSESTGRSASTPLLLHIRKKAHPWTTEDPFLYGIEVSLGTGNNADRVKSYFGLRKISIGKDENGKTRILLNNETLFQLGILDQGYFPDGLYTPPSYAAMENDLTRIKEMGFNTIRKHVKVEPAYWYHLCDKMGLLVWQDMPNPAPSATVEQQQFKFELKAMTDYLFNHPGIVMWIPFNEAWGQHDTERYTSELKEWDPGRLVNNASGWTDSGTGDIRDIHAYPGPAAPAPDENRAIVLGEFGGLGLNIRGHTWNSEGWGYQMIHSPDELLFAYEQLYRNLWPLADSTGLSAAIYTQLSDIESENNGLLTYDREVIKMEPSLLSLVHNRYLPPSPVSNTRIFLKKNEVSLETILPGAEIRYATGNSTKGQDWQLYNKPVQMKKSGSLFCKARWPDGTESHVQEYVFRKVKPVKSKVPKDLSPGLKVTCFEGEWDQLPDFSKQTPVRDYIASGPDLQGMEKEVHVALLFEGYVDVPDKAVYTFHLRSDDGSRLSVANQVLIENDGLHGLRKMSGSIALKKGKHPFRLAYFQKEGEKGLECRITGPDGKELPVNGIWMHE